MHIKNHGGSCCGMKTLYLGGTPSPTWSCTAYPAQQPPITPMPSNPTELDAAQFHTRYYIRANQDAGYWHRPFGRAAEYAGARAQSLLDFWNQKVKSGILEVVVISNERNNGTSQIEGWRPWLEEQGFKEVSSCYNSNSYNRVHVFHLVKDKADA